MHNARTMATAPFSPTLREDEVEITAVRAQGAGGQNVNKDRKSTRLNSSHIQKSRMPSSA